MSGRILILKDSSQNQIIQTNLQSFQSIASIVSTALGPKAMHKLILTQIGALQMTTDGNAILRELDVSHPAAKTLIEIANTQDDEVGDGTTSVIILAAAIFSAIHELKDIHPVFLSRYLLKALELCNQKMADIYVPVALTKTTLNKVTHSGTFSIDTQPGVKAAPSNAETKNITEEEIKIDIIRSSISTKLCSLLNIDIGKLAYLACEISHRDIKNMCKIEKILDSNFQSSRLINGVSLMKTIYHPQMRKRIENPRILNLKCHFDYLKGASQTAYEFKKETDFQRAQEIEIEQVVEKVMFVLKWKPDIICTQSAVNDIAMSLFAQNNVTVIRQLRTTEAERVYKATGAFVVVDIENIKEEDFGTCDLFEYEKFVDENYCRFDGCKKPEACTVYLMGPSNDILNELVRNFEDAIKVALNLKKSPMLVPGGGAFEMFLSNALMVESELLNDKQHTETNFRDNNKAYSKVLSKLSRALRIIPETLTKNAGVDDVLSLVNKLRVENMNDKFKGINGNTGEIQDMRDVIMESFSVKEQCLRSAIEVVVMIVRVDGVVKSKVKS
ncbi:T-complex protein 1 subunit gamma [Cucumispora dikerogammari]|nr:T-complex protein 1 subunit gamma [Cucumispora dikerogammari]